MEPAVFVRIIGEVGQGRTCGGAAAVFFPDVNLIHRNPPKAPVAAMSTISVAAQQQKMDKMPSVVSVDVY